MCSFEKKEVNWIPRIDFLQPKFSSSEINPYRAKFLKILLEMEWVDLWQLLFKGNLVHL